MVNARVTLGSETLFAGIENYSAVLKLLMVSGLIHSLRASGVL